MLLTLVPVLTAASLQEEAHIMGVPTGGDAGSKEAMVPSPHLGLCTSAPLVQIRS